MRRLIDVIAMILVTAALLPSSATQAAPQKRQQGIIVPGKSVGDLLLTMTPRQILDKMHYAPDKREVYTKASPEAMKKACAADEFVYYEWTETGLWFSTDLDEKRVRVIGVTGTSGAYVTDKGLEPLLDTLEGAVKAYGDGYEKILFPQCENPVVVYRFNGLGIQFAAPEKPGTTQHHRIGQIGVFVPGRFGK